MAPNQNNNQPQILSDNEVQVRFHNWKLNLDSIFQDIFHTITDNLPDMPYRDMFEEKVEENLIVLRMFQLIQNQ